MREIFLTFVGLAVWAVTGQAVAVTVLTLVGVKDLEPVQASSNAGLGGNGSGPGPNLGASFSGNALAVIDADAGGSGNIGHEPSPSTVLFFLSGTAATLNFAAGFDTGFSFFYSAVNNPGSINVFDGLDATGSLLATLALPVTASDGGDPNGAFSPLVSVGVAFGGTARSIDFGGAANQIAATST